VFSVYVRKQNNNEWFRVFSSDSDQERGETAFVLANEVFGEARFIRSEESSPVTVDNNFFEKVEITEGR